MSHTQKLLDRLTCEELIELKYQIENEIKKRQPGHLFMEIGDPVCLSTRASLDLLRLFDSIPKRRPLLNKEISAEPGDSTLLF